MLRGLTQPVRALSFEFTPEAVQTAYDCIERLSESGPYAYNVSFGESMAFELDRDVPKERILEILAGVAGDHRLFGDVYARRTSA